MMICAQCNRARAGDIVDSKALGASIANLKHGQKIIIGLLLVTLLCQGRCTVHHSIEGMGYMPMILTVVFVPHIIPNQMTINDGDNR